MKSLTSMQRIHWIDDVRHYGLKMYTLFLCVKSVKLNVVELFIWKMYTAVYKLSDIFPYPAKKEVSIQIG